MKLAFRGTVDDAIRCCSSSKRLNLDEIRVVLSKFSLNIPRALDTLYTRRGDNASNVRLKFWLGSLRRGSRVQINRT